MCLHRCSRGHVHQQSGGGDAVARRIADRRPGVHGTPNLSTFHSFCVRLLRKDGDPLAQIRPGFTRRFTIYDDEDQMAIIKAAYKKLGLDEKAMPYRSVMSVISQSKNTRKTAQDLYDEAKDPKMARVAAVFEEFERGLRTANALDFDDLLLETVRLLEHDAATREAYNRRISYLMIDEYQDTNRTQYQLMRLLTREHDNVCVVGDEDQSIYSWRRRGHPQHFGFRARLSQHQNHRWNRITAPPRTFWKRLRRWWRTTKNARASGSDGCGRGRRTRALHWA